MGGILRLEGIFHRYQWNYVLSDVSLSIRDGEIFGLLGPNGAGKSTAMRIVAGVMPPTRGRVLLGDSDIAGHSFAAKRSLALVPQEFAFFSDLSVASNLAFFGSQMGVPHLDENIGTVCELLELNPFLNQPAGSLSGGYKRMLTIAIALLQSPRVLFLDEPSVGLDPVNRAKLWKVITEINLVGVTVVLSTHYMEEAQALCERVCLLHSGRIAALDAPDALVARYCKAFLQVLTLSGLPPATWLSKLQADIPSYVCSLNGNILTLAGDKSEAAADGQLQRAVQSAGLTVLKTRIKEPDLEQAFINLTGAQLKTN